MLNITVVKGTQITQAVKLVCTIVPEFNTLSPAGKEIVEETIREYLVKMLKSEKGIVVIDLDPQFKKLMSDLGEDSMTWREAWGLVKDLPALYRISRKADQLDLDLDSIEDQLDAIFA